MNTHFLYLFGHLRLLEEQHALVSLNKTGIGLIGSPTHNTWYTEAILHSQHHCQLNSVCSLDSPIPSAAYFICQKRKIEHLIDNDAVDTIIVTSLCSEELLKFIIQSAINSGKNILLNNVPNYGTNELVNLLKLAKYNDVNICQNSLLRFSHQYDEMKSILSNKSTRDSGLLRLSAHRQIDKMDCLSKETLRSLIAEKVSLLLNLLPEFKFDSLSIQYSRPFSHIEKGDVLMINLKDGNGFLASLELFFNTGNVSDKLSLKQCHHDLQFENFLMSNNQFSIINENSLIIKQLDHFILNPHKTNKIVINSQLIDINKITESILNQLELNQFI
ncbi:hypothetical protein U2T78_001097 [Providencia stuartii]|uniref:Uncharacterized protein n=2 Tax=Providencia stuartii TaxID=588 RepID=A0AAJ1JGF3_PROST|nr:MULTISPECIES: hypothetical protein [Providencia]EMA3640439.1 hypothetical protein [Providencia stuartii]MBW3103102.1 hypothetical protein [Providencia stuartii]MDE5307152.1 hypothetical protein [Providencia stuartii]MDE8750767.1 hypothetical protein [Providencia thailandensis]MDE8770557.1 hypothetical protein [Providencia thailandensis]